MTAGYLPHDYLTKFPRERMYFEPYLDPMLLLLIIILDFWLNDPTYILMSRTTLKNGGDCFEWRLVIETDSRSELFECQSRNLDYIIFLPIFQVSTLSAWDPIAGRPCHASCTPFPDGPFGGPQGIRELWNTPKSKSKSKSVCLSVRLSVSHGSLFRHTCECIQNI